MERRPLRHIESLSAAISFGYTWFLKTGEGTRSVRTSVDLPRLRQLRAFEAVARLQSITGAAAEINLSQPAVTQALAKLEADLGEKLLERRHTGSFLSPAGKVFIRRVRRFFGQLRAALCEPLTGSPIADPAHVSVTEIRLRSSQIAALIAVSESGSFEEAARQLQISQPSLHRTARELEHVLRRTLYDRHASGFTTTPQGSELARRWKVALRELEYGREELLAARGAMGSRVIIGSLPLASATLLARAINKVSAEFPTARFQVFEMQYELLLSALRAGNIDFLYGVLRAPAWASDVVEEPLFQDPYVIAARYGHPLLSGAESITLHDLARYEWIMPAGGNPRRTSFDKLFAGSGTTPQVRIETHSVTIQKELLASSDRVTLLTRKELERDENALRLMQAPFDLNLRRSPDGVAHRADWEPTPLQSRFIESLRECAGAG